MGDRPGVAWRDVALPGAIAAASVVELAATQPGPWVLAALVEVLACVPMVWRRRFPVGASVLAMLTLFVTPWLGSQLKDASVPVALIVFAAYSLGRYSPLLRRAVIGISLIAVAITATYAVVDPRTHNWSDVIFVGALFLPPFVLGRLVARMAEQKLVLLEQQQWIEREAAKGERLRIARELHDVIAHSVSAMVVQTAVARDLVRDDPDGAVAALDTVTATGRGALAETGRVLRALRDEGDELGLPPAPGLDLLAELVQSFRDQGLAVDADIDTGGRPVPAAIDGTAYRVVQEALTNALRHGSDRSASLRVSLASGMLTVSVANAVAGTERGHAVHWDGSGLGLAGIQERVTLCGGQLYHGRGADGRYELIATLPVEPAVSPSEAGVAP